jgi:hypothetical protein
MAKSALASQNENENEILTAEAKAVNDGLEYFTKFKALISPAPKNPPAPIPVKSPEVDAVHGGHHNPPAPTAPADGGHSHYAPAADTPPAPTTSSDPLAAFPTTEEAPKTISSATAPPATAISNSPGDRSEDFGDDMSGFLGSLDGVPSQYTVPRSALAADTAPAPTAPADGGNYNPFTVRKPADAPAIRHKTRHTGGLIRHKTRSVRGAGKERGGAGQSGAKKKKKEKKKKKKKASWWSRVKNFMSSK